MASINFPSLRPSTREYTPGVFPQTEFTALNGAVTRIAYGNRRSQATLKLGFKCLSDPDVVKILDCYEAANGEWRPIVFFSNGPLKGLDDGGDLYIYMRERASGLKYRFAEPPTVVSVYPGRSDVSCSFVAYLDG